MCKCRKARSFFSRVITQTVLYEFNRPHKMSLLPRTKLLDKTSVFYTQKFLKLIEMSLFPSQIKYFRKSDYDKNQIQVFNYNEFFYILKSAVLWLFNLSFRYFSLVISLFYLTIYFCKVQKYKSSL